MVGKIKHVGLNMPDFEIINKSLKAGWVKRFLTTETQSWKTIPLSLLQAIGGSLLFQCNFLLKALPDLPLLPQFYKDVLGAWEEIIHTPKTRKETKDEILWNNQLQLAENLSFTFIKNGITLV